MKRTFFLVTVLIIALGFTYPLLVSANGFRVRSHGLINCSA